MSGDAAPGRVLALDYGSARCGVALSDPTRTLASPLDPVLRPATRRGLDRLAAVIRDSGAVRVVIGLPLTLRGEEGAQAAETRAFADRLRERLGERVPVELYDERFTTRIAARSGSGARSSEDSRAAAVLLDGWLAARGGSDR